mmetsp:Transcript_116861/g.268154  ORF Transcript_116861/g.268154 Transcript_116861/m.268154 type:complete len:266 (+) Transcript_116861:14-811(+)
MSAGVGSPCPRVLFFGANHPGVSSVISRFLGHAAPGPTESYSVFSWRGPSGSVELWDLGGAPGARAAWASFLHESVVALVWVFDASEGPAHESSEAVLLKKAPGVPCVFLSNKTDLLPGSPDDLPWWSEVPSIAGDRLWCVINSCASEGDGIQACMEWLVSEGVLEPRAQNFLSSSHAARMGLLTPAVARTPSAASVSRPPIREPALYATALCAIDRLYSTGRITPEKRSVLKGLLAQRRLFAWVSEDALCDPAVLIRELWDLEV